jgi:hypothetical protein
MLSQKIAVCKYLLIAFRAQGNFQASEKRSLMLDSQWPDKRKAMSTSPPEISPIFQ